MVSQTSVQNTTADSIVINAQIAPPPLPVSPDWSPVKYYGGYARSSIVGALPATTEKSHKPFHIGCCVHLPACNWGKSTGSLSQAGSLSSLWGPIGCSCFAF